MKRLFWLGVGATMGTLAVRKITRAVESVTPAGLAGSLTLLVDTVRDFADDVRVAMTEHEQELLEALGVDTDGSAASDGRVPAATSPPRHTHVRPR